MSTLQLPEAFKQSYNNFDSYPQDLIYQTSYRGTAQAYYTRLMSAAPKLFTDESANVSVPFRDLQPSDQGNFLLVDLRYVCSCLKGL